MLRRHGPATVAVSTFAFRVDAFDEPRCPQEHFANSRNFDNVYADGNDHE